MSSYSWQTNHLIVPEETQTAYNYNIYHNSLQLFQVRVGGRMMVHLVIASALQTQSRNVCLQQTAAHTSLPSRWLILSYFIVYHLFGMEGMPESKLPYISQQRKDDKGWIESTAYLHS